MYDVARGRDDESREGRFKMKSWCSRFHPMVASMILTGLVVSSSALAQEGEDSSGRQAKFSQEAFHFGQTIEGIIEKLGTPRQHDVERQPNEFGGDQVDEYHFLRYDGATVVVFKGATKQMIVALDVSLARFEFAYGIRVGTSVNEVREQLGTPLREEEDKLVYPYPCGELGHSSILLHHANNVITRIVWHTCVGL